MKMYTLASKTTAMSSSVTVWQLDLFSTTRSYWFSIILCLLRMPADLVPIERVAQGGLWWPPIPCIVLLSFGIEPCLMNSGLRFKMLPARSLTSKKEWKMSRLGMSLSTAMWQSEKWHKGGCKTPQTLLFYICSQLKQCHAINVFAILNESKRNRFDTF